MVPKKKTLRGNLNKTRIKVMNQNRKQQFVEEISIQGKYQSNQAKTKKNTETLRRHWNKKRINARKQRKEDKSRNRSE